MSVVASSPIVPNEALLCEFVSAEHSLKQSASKLANNRLLRNIWYASPNLEAATQRLARISSHLCPWGRNGEGSLLLVAMGRAATAYEDAMEVANRQETYEQAYLSALVDAGCTILEWEAIGVWEDGRTELWHYGDAPLLDWVRKRRPARVGFAPREEPMDEFARKAMRVSIAVTIFGSDHPEELVALLRD